MSWQIICKREFGPVLVADASRGLNERIMQAKHQSGIIVIDKPPDISSAQVVAKVKRLLKAKKVGHTGTLDPFAEGVLVCCINDATRLARFLLAGNKTYDATLKLGVETDTQDATGTVTATHAVVDCTERGIGSVVKRFTGPIEQQPPVYSALKHKGTPLYILARQGRPVQKPARKVHISKIKVLEIKLPLVHFEVTCSSGTYIRTLCADIGNQLGCGGHLLALKRIESSGFNTQQAISLAQLEKRIRTRELSGCIIGMADALVGMPAFRADQHLMKKIRHGQPIRKADIHFNPLANNDTNQDAYMKIVDADNNLLAVISYNKNQDRWVYACVFQHVHMVRH